MTDGQKATLVVMQAILKGQDPSERIAELLRAGTITERQAEVLRKAAAA